MRATTCPTPTQLSNWLHDAAEDASSAELEAHIDTCEICKGQIERIESGDLLLADLGGITTPPSQPNLDNDRLARITSAFQLSQDSKPSEFPTRIRDYELLEILGKGGMGTVFRARHLPLNRLVALKILPPDSGQRVARFQRELAHHGPLDHPHIVKALDAGEVDGVHFLVTELVEGKNASQLVAEKRPLSAQEACDIARQAALGLAYIHERGLVHRDVKPSNLMVDDSGYVRLLDLGLVAPSEAEPSDDRMTNDQTILGTPDYIAPEQINNPRNVDGRADLYSLGCTLFHLLSGKPPFANHPLLIKLHAHQFEEPDMRRISSPMAPELIELLGQLLAKQPALRPATAGIVAQRLTAIAPLKHNEFASVVTPYKTPLAPQQSPASTSNRGVLFLVLAILGVIVALPVMLILCAGFIYAFVATGVEMKPNESFGEQSTRITTDGGEEHVTEPAKEVDGDSQAKQLETAPLPADESSNSKAKQASTDPSSSTPATDHRPLATIPPPFRLGAHTQPVTAIAFAADGGTAYTTGAHQFEPLQTWDLKKRKAVESTAAGAVAVMSVHPTDPNQLLLGINHRVVAWDRSAKSEQAALSCSGTVTSLVSSIDVPTVVVGSDQGEVIVWNPTTSARTRALKLTGAISALAMSKDGGIIAAATAEKQVTIWNAVKDEVLASLPLNDRALALAFTEDASALYIVEGYTDRYRSNWQRLLKTDLTGTIKLDASIAETGEMCLAAALHGNTLLVGCADGSIRKWAIADGKATIEWRQKVHEQPVSALTISPSGDAAISGARDGSVYLLDLTPTSPK